MTAPIVVLAVGNPSRGDDAIGPVLSQRLADWLRDSPLAAKVELFEDFQLNIEHALDLVGRERVLFIDAGEGTAAPFQFSRVRPTLEMTHSSHELPPQAVLGVYLRTLHEEPPPAYVLCVRGEHFELGQPLSEPAQDHVEQAWTCLRQLLQPCGLQDWERLASA